MAALRAATRPKGFALVGANSSRGAAHALRNPACRPYVLMTSHVHLLITPGDEHAAGALMKALGQRDVQYINRSYQRSGTLWEGRFRSCLAQDERYTLACMRYIELNPVRAGMDEGRVSRRTAARAPNRERLQARGRSNHPRGYRFSSYRVNGDGKAQALRPGLITPHPQYQGLGKTDAERQQAYRALFTARLDEQTVNHIRQATHRNLALGSERFVLAIETLLGRRASVGKAGRPVTPRRADATQKRLI